MSSYWLDANVFIDAKNGLFTFELVPKFWKWLEDQLRGGVLVSSLLVYQEIVRSEGGQDALHKWAQERRRNGYWVPPNEDVQSQYRVIADHVWQRYGNRNPGKTANFLAKADVWVIAHALSAEATVVTGEVRVDRLSQTPKIPNVCADFNVACIGMKEMLTRLKFRAE